MNEDYLDRMVDRYTEAMHLVAHSTRNTGSPYCECVICGESHPEESNVWRRPLDGVEDMRFLNENEGWVCSEECKKGWMDDYHDDLVEYAEEQGFTWENRFNG